MNDIKSVADDVKEANKLLHRAMGKLLAADIGVGQRREERLLGSLLCKTSFLEEKLDRRMVVNVRFGLRGRKPRTQKRPPREGA